MAAPDPGKKKTARARKRKDDTKTIQEAGEDEPTAADPDEEYTLDGVDEKGIEGRGGARGVGGRKVPEEVEGQRGPEPLIIIIVSMIVLLCIVGGVYFLLSGSLPFMGGDEIESIAVGNIESLDKDGDGYRETRLITIYATASGFGDAEGKCIIMVYYGEAEEPTFETSVNLKNDRGVKEIELRDFVIGNGEYRVVARSGGEENYNTLWIYDVVGRLEASWTDMNTDNFDLGTHGYEVSMELRPLEADGTPLRLKGAPPVNISGSISTPAGGSVPVSIDSVASSTGRLPGPTITHTTRGVYSIAGSITNLICRPDSEFRTVLITNTTKTVDAPPYADAGGDITVPLVGGEAEVEFDGSASWDDGELIRYNWTFGDGGENETSVGYNSPTTTHTYTAEGEYYAFLYVVDDSGQDSLGRWGGYRVVTVTSS